MMRSDLKGTGTTSVIYVFVQQEVLHFLVILSWHILSQVLNRVLRWELIRPWEAQYLSSSSVVSCSKYVKPMPIPTVPPWQEDRSRCLSQASALRFEIPLWRSLEVRCALEFRVS
ncbi:hypothetical protein K439DRAFT_317096 [Ramaria rubella]|nr:hypothetical protein K439DRAFT_317096 [Ramaria rubella]